MTIFRKIVKEKMNSPERREDMLDQAIDNIDKAVLFLGSHLLPLKQFQQHYHLCAKGLIAELTPLHTQSAWGSRG